MSRRDLHQLVSRALHEARQFPVSGLTSIIHPLAEALHDIIDEMYSERPHTGGGAVESIGDVLARLTQFESDTGHEVPRAHGPLPSFVLHADELDADTAESLGFDSTTRTTGGEPVSLFYLSDGRVVAGFVVGRSDTALTRALEGTDD